MENLLASDKAFLRCVYVDTRLITAFLIKGLI